MAKYALKEIVYGNKYDIGSAVFNGQKSGEKNIVDYARRKGIKL